MKNIFKKNHIIITALAIMIVIAGYLALTDNDTPKSTDKTASVNPDVDDYEEFTELGDGLDVVTDTTGTGTDTTGTDTGNDTTAADDTGTTEDTNDTTADDNEESAPADTDEDTGDLGQNDISDEDLLETAQDVSDNGEINTEDGTPGEAVLASTTIDPSYFISRKLDREQVRARNRETFLEIIESPDLSEDEKKDAVQGMIELTDASQKESVAEMLLEAKGFDGAVVFINDGEVDVVVNAATLSDQQLAIIEDVIKDKTDIAVEHININPVVVAE
jgi:stage III sporulation protein AH